jgi:hypothetical protein
MRFKGLTRVYDFLQVLHIKRSHYTKNDYFPMYILFTIIYLLQEHKLNPNKYYDQENKYEKLCTSYWAWCANVCKFWRFNFLWIVVIKYSKLWFITIFYNAIMHKMEFGQVYYMDLLKVILNKFTLYFYEFYMNCYEFWKLEWFSGIFKQKSK